jgi:sugar/nucleoside kinase (ribokinase family)
VFSVYGVENPLMDIISHVDFTFLSRLGKKPGTMNLVEYDEVERLRAGLSSERTIPGGSCANTIRGLAWLNGSRQLPPPVFNGAVGRDPIGDSYAKSIEAAGVSVSLARKQRATGVSCILVTPDGERTMNTFLGACREFGPQDLDLEKLSLSRILHLTGYLWDTENQRAAAEKAVEFACGKGMMISFDLADPYAVLRYREAFLSFIPQCVDILFANREELGLLTGTDCDEDCMSVASPLAKTVVMKVGARGCYVGRGEEVIPVPGESVRVVDTTGAGDAFAGGYLHGVLLGRDAVECARIANRLAAGIVGVEGCDYQALGGGSPSSSP